MTPARCFEWPSVYVHCYITPPPSGHEGHISMRVSGQCINGACCPAG